MSLETIKLLPVLEPENVGANGGKLEYGIENFHKQTANQALESQTWDNFLSSETGSLTELDAARQLALLYMGHTALQMIVGVKSDEVKEQQAEWFTQQSIEMYGAQDVNETVGILSDDYNMLSTLVGRSDVDQNLLSEFLSEYESFGIKPTDREKVGTITSEQLHPSDKLFSNYLTENYGVVFESFDANEMYDAAELTVVATQVLEQLKNRDSRWQNWTVSSKSDGSMSVNNSAEKLMIGEKRASARGKDTAASLGHELIDHALRGINGREIGLAKGLPGSIDFEEGLGCYIEYIYTGKIPTKIVDRTIAASLALGQLGNTQPYDRNETYEFLKRRKQLLSYAHGGDGVLTVDEDNEIRTLIVDRFYRGGDGVQPVMPIYTKDIVYASGFKVARDLVRKSIENGTDVQELFTYLFSCTFDPTNQQHVNELNNLGINAPIRMKL